MMNQYSIKYFIKKFEATSEDQWTRGSCGLASFPTQSEALMFASVLVVSYTALAVYSAWQMESK